MEIANKEIIENELKKIFYKDCKNILIINPPQITKEDFDVSVARLKNYPCFPPYGPGLLCRHLSNRGYKTDIIDLNFEVLLAANEEDNFEYSSWKNKLKEKLETFNPDLVGISCMYSMSHKSLKEVSNFIKEVSPNLPIIAGGVHVSCAPEQVLNDCKSIDIILLYEGDLSFPILLDHVNKSSKLEFFSIAMLIDGKYYAVYDRISPSGEIINLTPEYHNLKIEKYSALGKIGESRWLLPEGTKISSVLSNRGCRGDCQFCGVRTFNGAGVRTRSVKAVIDEIELLKNKYGILHIMWLDNDLLFNKNRALELFNEIIKRNLGITWNASNGVIAASIDDEIMKAISESGCTCLYIGIESGSPEILNYIKKPSGIKQFLKAGECAKKYPEVFTKGFLMIGLPGENIGQINKTLELARQMELDWYAIQIYIPFPSTPIAESLIKENKFDNKKFIDGSTKFFVGGIGKQRQRENEEKLESRPFENTLKKNTEYVPNEDELKDI